jgi:hypothetical protein
VIDGIPNSNVVAEIGVEAAAGLISLEATVLQTIEPLGARWHRRLEAAESRIQDLVGEVVPPEAWALARKRSVEVLEDDLTEQVVNSLGKTDAELPAFDLRRALTVAGVD